MPEQPKKNSILSVGPDRSGTFFRCATLAGLVLLSASPTKAQQVDSLVRAGEEARLSSDLESLVGAGEERLRARFLARQISFPPEQYVLIALKTERRLELWAPSPDGRPHLVHSYEILALSGGPGPKLREGDGQVPEGMYRLESLLPHSQYHLGLKLNFPNDFDWARAREEQRNEPGSDIFIHGGEFSTGCLAIGDRAVEEIFALAVRSGMERARVLIAPYDLRDPPETRPAPPANPAWLAGLYEELRLTMMRYHEAEAIAPPADPTTP